MGRLTDYLQFALGLTPGREYSHKATLPGYTRKKCKSCVLFQGPCNRNRSEPLQQACELYKKK